MKKLTELFLSFLQGFKEKRELNGGRLFALIIVILVVCALWVSWRNPISCTIRKQQPIFGILVGTDWVDYARHSDTIILARYEPGSRSLDLLSIPRDTKINFPELRVKRINEIYAYAYRTKKDHDIACKELIKAVQRLLFSHLLSTGSLSPETVPQIPYYVQVDYKGFRKMIDLLGGVEVTIDEPMHYDDNWGNLHIHFDPGQTLLNGQKALEYIRFRGFTGDFGRVVRQQEFLLNVLNRFKNPINIFKLPQIIWTSLSSTKTNLGWMGKLMILWELKDLRKERIRLMQLPGKASRDGFWIVDEEGMNATAMFLATGKGNPEEKSFTSSEDQNISKKESENANLQSKITVEVWNASSKKGLALEVVRKLRTAGFDVVKWGNYESRQMRTFVRDHAGEIQQARSIANLLASPKIEVFTRLEANPLVDIEVVLGEDYGAGK